MSTSPELNRDLRSWLREDGHENADRVLHEALDAIATTPQRRAGWPARRFPVMNRFVGLGAVAAVAVLATLIGIQALSGSRLGGPEASATSSPAQSPGEESPTTTGTDRGWPGSGENPPGLYAFGAPSNPQVGRYGWMHNGYQDVGEGQGITITMAFADEADWDPSAEAATIAGYGATYEATSGAEQWVVDIDGTFVEISLTPEPMVTAAQLADAHAIIESIRVEPQEELAGFRLTFVLPQGWDSG